MRSEDNLWERGSPFLTWMLGMALRWQVWWQMLLPLCQLTGPNLYLLRISQHISLGLNFTGKHSRCDGEAEVQLSSNEQVSTNQRRECSHRKHWSENINSIRGKPSSARVHKLSAGLRGIHAVTRLVRMHPFFTLPQGDPRNSPSPLKS